MTVPFRILSLLLCLLVAGPMSTSARAVARPETRVGNFFPASPKTAVADLAQTAGTRWENPACSYDFASGVCKYLYAHADPVNGVDPSGNMTSTIEFGIASTMSMNLRATWERNRAPIYKGAILAAITVAGVLATSAVAEAIQIQDAEMSLAEAGTSVRNEIAKAAQIIRTRIGNIRLPKIVPIPMSVIPNVAQNVAVGQLTTPGPLTRVGLVTTVKNRYNATKGRGSAGPGMSWDEYPFASTLQGGAPAVVRAVPREQNWIQGGIIAAAYVLEKISVGDSFVVVITP